MTATAFGFDLIDDPFFPEDVGGPARPLDVLGHCFPPLARELRRQLADHFRAGPAGARWYVPTVQGHDPYGELPHTDDADALPALIMDLGLGKFARSGFIRRWGDSGRFRRRRQTIARPEFTAAGFADPDGMFQVVGAGAWVILADRVRLGGRPAPRCWADLTHPRFGGDIVANGRDGRLTPPLAFNLYGELGEDGLTALGANVKAIWGGAQMARTAGTDNPDGAALYVLPRFWALANGRPERVDTVWPRDGAICAPVLLLRRAVANAAADHAETFLTAPAWARTLDGAACASVRPDIDARPLPGPLRWLGWDRVRAWDLDALRPVIDAAFAKGFAHSADKGSPA